MKRKQSECGSGSKGNPAKFSNLSCGIDDIVDCENAVFYIQMMLSQKYPKKFIGQRVKIK